MYIGRVSPFRARFAAWPKGGYVESPEGGLAVLLALDPNQGSGDEMGDFFWTFHV